MDEKEHQEAFSKGYGKVPVKDVEQEPWCDACADHLSGPWKATLDGKEVASHALTIIDPFTSWTEIVPIQTRKKEHILQDLIEQEWLQRYPRPTQFIFDQGDEFENFLLRKALKDWHI
jgi:hypothetical protein